MDLVRSICSAWGRGDYSSGEWADPEIEFVTPDGLSPGEWAGRAGMAEGWGAWLSAWDDFHQEPEEYRRIDEERVLVFFRVSGRGKTSGLELAQVNPRIAAVFHVRGGSVTRFVGYLDPERALADLGLRE
jgi:ketosteroid isomerase-like protein